MKTIFESVISSSGFAAEDIISDAYKSIMPNPPQGREYEEVNPVKEALTMAVLSEIRAQEGKNIESSEIMKETLKDLARNGRRGLAEKMVTVMAGSKECYLSMFRGAVMAMAEYDNETNGAQGLRLLERSSGMDIVGLLKLAKMEPARVNLLYFGEVIKYLFHWLWFISSMCVWAYVLLYFPIMLLNLKFHWF
jgi:hypothetical protein